MEHQASGGGTVRASGETSTKFLWVPRKDLDPADAYIFGGQFEGDILFHARSLPVTFAMEAGLGILVCRLEGFVWVV